ncbi:DUF4880 domain-containing protein [Azoarcus sp. TTM-91]|uniref:FecR domain-containing protein n=1 Tax=Azoarcus sp. TTM-91 TaxID=2691581 RepID=UPI00145FA916|nr:FecR domain-containing protein [Azoarcus sp. TTM-91]NMG36852.1 DUF4880 domain-containing protein [Azoarcus sp. TTM-91]
MSPPGRFAPLAPEAGALASAVVAQAAEWIVRLQHDDRPATRQACADWRALDPQHELAWQRLSALGRELRASARAVPAPLAAATLEQARASLRRHRRDSIKWMLGLGAVGLGAWQGRDALQDVPAWQALRADLHTATGQRSEHRLADGSQLVLNSRSAVDIDFDERQRRILLRSGEIMVSTAPDAAGRPFVVSTEHGALLPVGTRFSVRRLDAPGRPIRLAVFEGAVDIRPAGQGAARRLPAGRQLAFTADALLPERSLHPGEDAWTRGMLIANRMPLADFIAELDRHRSGFLRCRADAAGLQVTGAFPLDDIDGALAMLETILPLRVERFSRYWTTVALR